MQRKRFTVELKNETNEILEKMAKETQRSKVGMIRFLIDTARGEIIQKGGEDGKLNK